MTLFEGLQASPTLLVVAVAILGLLVGSFLNVVILRLPRIMEQNWKRDARDALELPAIEEPRLSLSHPASCCPSCKAPIRPWPNVPVISWLALRGRCAHSRRDRNNVGEGQGWSVCVSPGGAGVMTK